MKIYKNVKKKWEKNYANGTDPHLITTLRWPEKVGVSVKRPLRVWLSLVWKFSTCLEAGKKVTPVIWTGRTG